MWQASAWSTSRHARQTWPSSIAWPGQLSRETLDDISPQGRALLGEIKTLCEEQPRARCSTSTLSNAAICDG